MTLILRSLPLSFLALLRALPALVVAIVAWLILAFGAGMFLGLLAVYAILIVASTHLSLVFMRAAITMNGGAGPLMPGQLVISGLLFSLLQGAVGFAIGTVGSLALAAMMLTGGSNPRLMGRGPTAMTEAMMSSPSMIAISVVFGGLIAAALTALLVPMAAAAAGEDETGRRREFFWGFGARFLPLFLMSAAAMIAVSVDPIASAVARLMAGLFTAAGDITAGMDGAIPGGPGPILASDWLYLGLSFWIYIWLYTATALAFLDHAAEATGERSGQTVLPRVDAADLRDLRKRRQQ